MSRFIKFLVAADLHGDKQDKKAVSAFREFHKEWKPDLFVFAGDLWDFRPMRRNASKEEKAESMQYDFLIGMEFLEEFRPKYFLRGNHDERLWEFARDATGPVQDYSVFGVKQVESECAKLGTKILPYDKKKGVLKIGHLKVLHGYFAGVYAARRHALVYGSCLFGHIHAIDEHAIEGLERRSARSIGCLCQLDMEYAKRMPTTLRWAHGWAYGIIDTAKGRGDYWVFQAEKIGGRYMLPTSFKEIK